MRYRVCRHVIRGAFSQLPIKRLFRVRACYAIFMAAAFIVTAASVTAAFVVTAAYLRPRGSSHLAGISSGDLKKLSEFGASGERGLKWSWKPQHPRLRNNNSSNSSSHYARISTPLWNRAVVARTFGNNMYPLQQADQGSTNLNTIMHKERLPNDFLQLFVVHRILNATEEELILRLVQSEFAVLRSQVDLEEVRRRYIRDPSQALTYVTNVNAARNMAINHAMSMQADWVILLDGNTFMTEEALQILSRQLDRDALTGKLVRFIPMFRIREKSTQYSLTSGTNLTTLMREVGGPQEPYIAIHRAALTVFKERGMRIFSEDDAYGENSKVSTLISLTREVPELLSCADAKDWSEKRWTQEMMEELKGRCSYALRLLYWPSESPGSASPHLGRVSRVMKLMQPQWTTENNNYFRTSVRKDSMSYLKHQIEQLVKYNSTISAVL